MKTSAENLVRLYCVNKKKHGTTVINLKTTHHDRTRERNNQQNIILCHYK